jgi:hypothetical protein
MSLMPAFIPRVSAKRPDGGNQIGCDAIALRVIFDAIEKDRRPRL